MTLLYPFDAELDSNRRLELLGTKASGLHEVTSLGIPVPPGFTITTEVGAHYRRQSCWPQGLEAAVKKALAGLEGLLGKAFGDPADPLLLSVRSGAPISMPGMMDTLLNVGLNDRTVEGLASKHANPWFAYDAYRRLIQMYGTVVRQIAPDRFQFRLTELKTRLGRPRLPDTELPEAAMRELTSAYISLIDEASGSPFPQDVSVQLWEAIAAVFESWNNTRAVRYRRMEGIEETTSTACTVQSMVFGNTGPRSGSGVVFTRNPSSGDKQLYGEYLPNAQGEDVVAGLQTPVPLTMAAAAPGKERTSLEAASPEAFESLSRYCTLLESHFGDVQDIEFTIEDGRPYILQTRAAKRTARAAVRIAVQMMHEGMLSKEQALLRVDPRALEQLLQARLPGASELAERGILPSASGLPASPGAASGRIVFHADDALRWATEGQDVILVRRETSTEDIHGIKAAKGVLTAAGGMTSHAAVVARALGKCCVVGCSALTIDPHGKNMCIAAEPGAATLEEGDLLTLDGSTGNVYAGSLDLVASTTVEELHELMAWADQTRRLRVYAEADTPQVARAALSYGAEGVGLCRTERMFFAPDRLFALRCALLAVEDGQRSHFLAELERVQRDDFLEIFEAMGGRPVTIRLLDRALEEMMPQDEKALEAIAHALDLELDEVIDAAQRHRESNPAFGHRGVRAGLTVPGLYETQLRAMLLAARDCSDRKTAVELEVLIPMVAFASEVVALRKILDRIRNEVFAQASEHFACRVGAMIELPRACLIAADLAGQSDFFSFGGNDLTQTVLGVSRDDANRFLPTYRNDLGLIQHDPFDVLDPRVIEMMSIAMKRAVAVKPSLIAGLCGDQGGSPDSIVACETLGLDFVSAPVSRLPGARLAAAQARIR